MASANPGTPDDGCPDDGSGSTQRPSLASVVGAGFRWLLRDDILTGNDVASIYRSARRMAQGADDTPSGASREEEPQAPGYEVLPDAIGSGSRDTTTRDTTGTGETEHSEDDSGCKDICEALPETTASPAVTLEVGPEDVIPLRESGLPSLAPQESSGEESSEDEESLLAPFARAADHGSPGEVPESPLQQHVLPQTRGPPEPSAPATVSIQNLVDTTDCMRIQAEQAAHAHQSVIQVQPMSTQQQGAPLPRGQTARSQVTIEGVAQPETIRILPGPRAATSGTLLADECHAIPTNMFIDVDAELFVGREMELAQLRRMLEKDRLVSISGMGGAGKTTAACLHAYGHFRSYKNGVFLVDASKLSTLPINFAALAGKDILNLLPNFDQDIQTSIKLVSRWLCTHSDYLLVFDAADDVTIIQELIKQLASGYRYIPDRSDLQGHVVITSRCPMECFEGVQIKSNLRFGDLSTAEACTFLWKRVYYDEGANDPREECALQELVTKYVSKLPLYLESTASHIRGQNITFQEYLKIVSRKPRRNPVDNPAFGDNRKTVDDSFTGNFEAVYTESAEASYLLDLASLCHSQNIPMSLFSVGAAVLAMATGKQQTQADLEELIRYLMADMNATEINKNKMYKDVSAKGEGAVRKLLQVPWRFHLVTLNRVGSDFAVHEVIQEQLRLRMMDRDRVVPTLQVLATILLHVLRADDILLTTKRLFLSHAETSSGHMKTFSLLSQEHMELYLRLRIKTGLTFASLGFFPTAWDLVEDIEKDMSGLDLVQLRAEFYGLKARICVLQHRPREALAIGKEGLEMIEGDCSQQDVYVLLEYAVLHRSCAHSYIAMHRSGDQEAIEHMEKARQTFESVQATSGQYCEGPYSNLLMLYGQLYRNIGVREPPESETFHRNYSLALHWFLKAVEHMDTEGYMVDLCKIHIAITRLKLDLCTGRECVNVLRECHATLEEKLGRCHRYTAWVLEKIAIIQVDDGCPGDALGAIDECLDILKRVYGDNDGKVQVGGTLKLKGKALLHVGRAADSAEVLATSLEMLSETPDNPGFSECRQLLQEARQRAGKQEEGTQLP